MEIRKAKHGKSLRLQRLPEDMRRALKEARFARKWTQDTLGRKVELPQAHISGIEAGKIVPRFDTLLDVVRTLDHDLVLVPRALVPAVLALIRDQQRGEDGEERSLYAGARGDDA